ncbi:ribosome-inactivating protein [Calothrix sp. PCC 6303]|uniref:ribosome-inactivating protein n=1 Tax=Calothrix sp. PCC 6303 TaxID=1170562 RepID=UPI0002A00A6C|nr:ribosome-inactivating protein [Calothrix sp. PCC 6303]AFZ01156.1 ribosome-inactivating protein [Calothrix sp. PCC 6303]
MKNISNLLLQKRFILRLGAIITTSLTTLSSPAVILASEVSEKTVFSQKSTTINSDSTFKIAQQPPRDPSLDSNDQNPPIEVIQTTLLDSLDDYIRAVSSIRNSQTELVNLNIPGSSTNPPQIRRTRNQADNVYFTVQVEFEGNNIGFVFRRRDLYLQGYINSRNSTYYYFREATVTSVRQANSQTQLSATENYNSLLGGEFSRADFNLDELRQSFRNLVNNNPSRNSQSINTALVRFAVAISEAVRFNEVGRNVARLFRNPSARINFEETHDTVLSNWSRYSNIALNATNSETSEFYEIRLGVALFINISK